MCMSLNDAYRTAVTRDPHTAVISLLSNDYDDSQHLCVYLSINVNVLNCMMTECVLSDSVGEQICGQCII